MAHSVIVRRRVVRRVLADLINGAGWHIVHHAAEIVDDLLGVGEDVINAVGGLGGSPALHTGFDAHENYCQHADCRDNYRLRGEEGGVSEGRKGEKAESKG